MTSEEPYQGLKFYCNPAETRDLLRDSRTGAAWLSSARVLRCFIKLINERNPYRVLQVSRETALLCREEGGDDVKSAWPSDTLGYTHVTMATTMGCEAVRRS